MSKADKRTLTLAEAAKKLRDAHEGGETWDEIAARMGLSKPLVWRVAFKGYNPKRPLFRRRLGLSPMELAPVCPKCGTVHVTKKCTANLKRKQEPTCYGCACMGEPYRNWRKLGHADGCPWGDKPRPGVTVIERNY